MSLTVLPGNQQKVSFAYPVALLVHAEHVFEAELLPWQ